MHILHVACEFGICEALANDLLHGHGESFRVGRATIVVPERQFINAAEQVERLDAVRASRA